MEEEVTMPPLFGVDEYIGFAESLKERCQRLDTVHGIRKLERKIHAELKFLNSLKERQQRAHPSHLHSSNLCHFASIVHATEELPGVVSVLQPFRSPGRGQKSLVVDVVACQGHHWVKVIARKGQALHLVWAGQGQFGERDLVSQAEDYLHASNHNHYHFSSPKVHMVFYNQVTFPMAEALTSRGISVWGQKVKVHDDVMFKLTSVMTLDDTFDEDDEEIEDEDGDDWCEYDTNHSDGNAIRRTPSVSATGEPDNDNINDKVSSRPGCITTRPLDDDHTQCPSHPLLDESRKPLGAENNEKTSSSHSVDDSPSSSHKNPHHYRSCITSSSSSREPAVSFLSNDNNENHNAKSFETSTTPENTNTRFLEPSLEGVCAANTPYPAPLQPHDALFGCIVISPPDYRTFPLHPTDIADAQCLQTVQGDNEPSSSSTTSMISTTAPLENVSALTRVNLDITSLITLVSNVTHGHCHLVFKEKVLASQALEERHTPCLPPLESYLEGKQLFACQTAVDSFQTILDVLGGPREKERAARLLADVTVVPDQLSTRACQLETQGKIKERSKAVFGTGDFLKAVTVTSNTGFVRAARHQGVAFSVFTHPARALTEEKEQSATPL